MCISFAIYSSTDISYDFFLLSSSSFCLSHNSDEVDYRCIVRRCEERKRNPEKMKNRIETNIWEKEIKVNDEHRISNKEIHFLFSYLINTNDCITIIKLDRGRRKSMNHSYLKIQINRYGKHESKKKTFGEFLLNVST